MSSEAQQVAAPAIAQRTWLDRMKANSWRFITKQPTGSAGLAMVVSIVFLAVLANVVGRYDPFDQDYTQRLIGPSVSHFMGTDDFGRDLWARIVHGSRISITVGFVAVFTGSVLGLVLGVISGYMGGWVDNVFQRFTEVMLSIPGLLLALALMATLGSGVEKVIFALSIGYVPRTLRVMRGTVLSVKENVYIDASRAIGAAPMRIMFRHVLPNVMAPYLIIATSLLGTAILAEATLSFLGLGVPPPIPSWGRMLAGSVARYATSAPWLVIFPGLAITWLVLGFNLFGDALRDVWDPRLRGSQ